MFLKYFYDKKLAQASYMVGCQATGEALVIDPSRDITPYLDAAEQEDLRITHVTETHIHADYVSGSRELATKTGASIFLSDEGDESWKYGYTDTVNAVLVKDGDRWMVGNIRVEVIHTPGHTPEHISFMITDTAAADRPIGVFTGDFIFVGDVGRPDLLEAAAGMVGTKEVGARLQYQSVARFKDMPDYLQIWPGHGAGSACGKALGAVPSTTLGYEKLFNPAFQHDDEDKFVAWLLEGQPEVPYYFAQMKTVNREGPALLAEIGTPGQLDRDALDTALAENAPVLDMRARGDFATGHIPGTINIPASDGGCVNYVGWFVDYEGPLYIIVPSVEEADSIIRNLRAIGVDNIGGYFTPDVVAGHLEQLDNIGVEDLINRMNANELVVLDVRGEEEYRSGHISGAKHIPLGYIPRQLDSIPKDKTLVTQCASGTRSQIAASVLLKYGFKNVLNLDADTQTWTAHLETERS